jgi:hypothetical protein
MVLVVALVSLTAGCSSMNRADNGALFGGLGGAGLGAVVGNAVGSPGAGAAIGAGVGALSGAAIGGSLDEMEAKNRYEIEQRLGRQVAARAATINDVVEMTHAGVNDDLIVSHVRSHGVSAPLAAGDIIHLQKQGVSTRVIEAMQAGPQPVRVAQGPPVIVEPVYAAPYCGPPPYWYHHHHHYHPRHRVHWDLHFGH